MRNRNLEPARVICQSGDVKRRNIAAACSEHQRTLDRVRAVVKQRDVCRLIDTVCVQIVNRNRSNAGDSGVVEAHVA